MSDARRNVRLYTTIKDRKSPLQGSRPSVPHGTNFYYYYYYYYLFLTYLSLARDQPVTCESRLSLCFNGHFYSWTLANRYQNVSILYFVEAQGEGPGGDNWSCKPCKSAVKSLPQTNRHAAFCRPDALPVAQPAVSRH